MKNAIPTNVTSTISINSDDKKVRFLKKEDIFLYSAHSFIGDHTTVYNRCYLLSFCKTQVKTKKHDVVLISKMENSRFNKVGTKICTCYYFDHKIKV